MACIELPCMKIRDIQKSINIFKSKLVYWITWETPSIYCHFIQKKMSTKGQENLLYTCYFYCEAHQMSSFVTQGWHHRRILSGVQQWWDQQQHKQQWWSRVQRWSWLLWDDIREWERERRTTAILSYNLYDFFSFNYLNFVRYHQPWWCIIISLMEA